MAKALHLLQQGRTELKQVTVTQEEGIEKQQPQMLQSHTTGHAAQTTSTYQQSQCR